MDDPPLRGSKRTVPALSPHPLRQRPPGDHFSRMFIDDLGVPLELRTARSLDDPMRPFLARLLDREDMRHEFRDIREILPIIEKSLGGRCTSISRVTLIPLLPGTPYSSLPRVLTPNAS